MTHMNKPMSEGAARELKSGKDELRRLMRSIWLSEYRHAVPDWQPLDDLLGMISQIDNMYAGVRGQRDDALHGPLSASAERAAIVAWLREAVERLKISLPGDVTGEVVLALADAIERGDHSKETGE